MQPAGVALQRSHPVHIIDDYFREARLPQSAHVDEYNSHNTTRLDVAGMKALLLNLGFMQRTARGERVAAEDLAAKLQPGCAGLTMAAHLVFV